MALRNNELDYVKRDSRLAAYAVVVLQRFEFINVRFVLEHNGFSRKFFFSNI